MALDIVFNKSNVMKIGAAISETLNTILQFKTNPDVQLQAMSNEHNQLMEKLQINKMKEQYRHEQISKLLDFFKKSLEVLAIEIETAEYNGCKGLPG